MAPWLLFFLPTSRVGERKRVDLDTSNYLWIARVLALLHAVIVGITVAGGIAIFTGRFRQFRRDDIFAWTFIACCLGQLLSLTLTGGCILTSWQRQCLLHAGEGEPFSGTFLQSCLPWLPNWFAVRGVPLLTMAAMIGAIIQIIGSIRRSRQRDKQ